MEQNTRHQFCSELILYPNKIITYNGEEFKVDFDLIKRNCKYFYEHRSEFDPLETIEINDPTNLPPKTFQSFLDCSQNQLTYIDDILGVNYFSIKYQNAKLLKYTQDCIKNDYNQLIFESILLKSRIQNTTEYQLKKIDIDFNIDTSNEEKILAEHFIEYIEDDRIFKLSIPVLDRVMKIFIEENKELFGDENKKKKIYNFLLRCLKEYKTPASILFLNINFDKLDRDLIVHLRNDFGDIFDFNMINVKSLFDATYELIGENSKILSLVKEISDQRKSEMEAFNQYKLNIEQELKEIREEQKRLIEQNQEQFSSRIQTLEDNQKNSSGRIQSLEDKNNLIEQKLQNIDGNQGNSTKRIQALEDNQRNSSGKIQSLENQYNSIEQKIRGIDENQRNSSGKIQSLENKQTTIERQMSTQTQNQQSMQSSLNSLKESCSKFATREISTKIQSNFNHHFM